MLDVVSARLDRVSADCRRLVQAAAIAGHDFSLVLVAATLDEPVEQCLPLIDEAIACGLLDRIGDIGDYRFVHALTRDAVEASLTTADGKLRVVTLWESKAHVDRFFAETLGPPVDEQAGQSGWPAASVENYLLFLVRQKAGGSGKPPEHARRRSRPPEVAPAYVGRRSCPRPPERGAGQGVR